ncbi:MAG: helix-turn-helix transcriptional regulator [Planctomycetota bacterium]
MKKSSVSDRHARILKILRQLQAGGRRNVAELAGELNVCRRTVFRDLNTLRQAGIELDYDARLDCYQLPPQREFVPAPELDLDELTTLVAAVHLSVLSNVPECHDLLRQSINKLLVGSPRHVRQHAIRVMKSCAVHAEGEDDVQKHPLMHQILTAITQRKILRVTIIELGVGDEAETRFAPYQMVAAANTWRVTGRSSLHGGVCTFGPRQMKRPEVTDEIYAIPRQYESAV